VCVCVCEPASIANQQPVVPDPVAQQCFPEPKLTMRCTSTTSIIIGSITTTRASQVPPTSAISCNSNSELTPPDTPPRPLETQFLHDHVLQLLDNLRLQLLSSNWMAMHGVMESKRRLNLEVKHFRSNIGGQQDVPLTLCLCERCVYVWTFLSKPNSCRPCF
jgi:hypothetical protein